VLFARNNHPKLLINCKPLQPKNLRLQGNDDHKDDRQGGRMLVLTRKKGEGIIIGENIRITILDNKEGRVRVGIEAPPEKKIFRTEVYERICQENKEASQWDLNKLDVLSSLLSGKKDPK
jgi:carbon storage regulator